MKNITTILASLCFMLGGAFLAFTSDDSATTLSTPMYAAPPPVTFVPQHVCIKDTITLHDTIPAHDTIRVVDRKEIPVIQHDTVEKPVVKYKTKIVRAKAKTVERIVNKTDTLYVPSLYVIMPLEKDDSKIVPVVSPDTTTIE